MIVRALRFRMYTLRILVFHGIDLNYRSMSARLVVFNVDLLSVSPAMWPVYV